MIPPGKMDQGGKARLTEKKPAGNTGITPPIRHATKKKTKIISIGLTGCPAGPVILDEGVWVEDVGPHVGAKRDGAPPARLGGLGLGGFRPRPFS